jgi:hypothetical protein
MVRGYPPIAAPGARPEKSTIMTDVRALATHLSRSVAQAERHDEP